MVQVHFLKIVSATFCLTRAANNKLIIGRTSHVEPLDMALKRVSLNLYQLDRRCEHWISFFISACTRGPWRYILEILEHKVRILPGGFS